MDKKKILKKPKKLQKRSIMINGVKLFRHDPSSSFKNHNKIKKALAESLLDGDRESFIDILSGYVRTHNILEVCRRTGLSRTVVYEAISEKANPSLETLCKIMISFKETA